ncbi:MAG TPA: hypothetical protein VFQ39_17575 [Longimicrobium sp.]|nr:hypothetical protein [Longimicrobium sp.]
MTIATCLKTVFSMKSRDETVDREEHTPLGGRKPIPSPPPRLSPGQIRAIQQYVRGLPKTSFLPPEIKKNRPAA